jgi:hypothetical protein
MWRVALVIMIKNVVLPLVLSCFCVLTWAAEARSHQREIEYQIKASYIYNFLQFVNFEHHLLGKDRELVVCILGEDRFQAALDELDSAPTPQGTIRIARMGAYTPKHTFDQCHVVYMVETEAGHTADVLERIDRQETMTISEHAAFISAGGLIELYVQNDSIKFRINERLVQQAKFHMSAQLIELGVVR